MNRTTIILNEIKKHLNLATDIDLTRFLGIKRNVLSNWKNRNSYDAEFLYTKCDFLNAEFLLGGKGDVIKKKNTESLTYLKDKKEDKIKTLPISINIEEDLIEKLTERVYSKILNKLDLNLLDKLNNTVREQKDTLNTLEAIIGLNILSDKLIVQKDDLINIEDESEKEKPHESIN